MRRRAIVTVGVDYARKFGPYHERFEKTLAPAAGLSCADDIKRWETEWPPGSPTHAEAHYAFKVHALKDAWRRGFTSLLWLDVSCYAVASLEPLWKVIEEQGYFLAGEPALDSETGLVAPDCDMASTDKLGEWSSDQSLSAFKVTRDQAMRIPLLCGCIIGLDLMHQRSRTFLDRMISFAVPEHFNGTHASGLLGMSSMSEGWMVSDDPRVRGHRSDEVYMSLLARELKMPSSAEFFTGGMAPKPSTVLRSGYSL